MLHNRTLMKVLNNIALVIFIFVMVVSLMAAIMGFASANGIFGTLEDVDIYHGSDTVSGWATIGALIGVGLGSFAGIGAALICVMGIMGAVADLLLYLPAYIARIICKKEGSIAAYWILMGLWLLALAVCLILFVSDSGLLFLSL